MKSDMSAFDSLHLLVEHATRSLRHAALIVLAGMGLPRPASKPDTPITALASAFKGRF